MEGAGVSDMSYEKHFLEHFHKACFNLLHELVMRRALSIELEEHLVNQVLKVEDGKSVICLVLLVKVYFFSSR